jgi:uracil-DNA glycosylase family 4
MKNKDAYEAFGLDEVYLEKSINRFEEESDEIKKEIILTDNNIKKKSDIKSKFSIQSVESIEQQARELVKKISTLDDLKKTVEDFDKCALKKLATNTVFSDGSQDADIMIIDEAPGNHEDLQGIPFCGDNGKMISDMFESIGFSREKLYISNMVFWRPPGNRNPTDEEIRICRPFVERHIFLKKPKLIIFVGAIVTQNMLNLSGAMTKARGNFLEYTNQYLENPIQAFPIFHPSYLMRQPSKKKVAWMDMLKISSQVTPS